MFYNLPPPLPWADSISPMAHQVHPPPSSEDMSSQELDISSIDPPPSSEDKSSQELYISSIG